MDTITGHESRTRCFVSVFLGNANVSVHFYEGLSETRYNQTKIIQNERLRLAKTSEMRSAESKAIGYVLYF